MIIRTPRNPNLAGLGRARRRGLNDYAPQPAYESCDGSSIAGVLCEQRNALARTNWDSANAQAKCDQTGVCDIVADPSGNLTRMSPGGTPMQIGWNPTGSDSLAVVVTPTYPASPHMPAPPATPALVAGGPGGSTATLLPVSTSAVDASPLEWLQGAGLFGFPMWALLAAGAGALYFFGGSRGR